MTILSALDKINDAIAGEDQPAEKTIEGALNAIASNAAPASTNGAFFVRAEEVDGVVQLDHTDGELRAVLESAPIILIIGTLSGTNRHDVFHIPFAWYTEDPLEHKFAFAGYFPTEDEISYEQVVFQSENTSTYPHLVESAENEPSAPSVY